MNTQKNMTQFARPVNLRHSVRPYSNGYSTFGLGDPGMGFITMPSLNIGQSVETAAQKVKEENEAKQAAEDAAAQQTWNAIGAGVQGVGNVLTAYFQADTQRRLSKEAERLAAARSGLPSVYMPSTLSGNNSLLLLGGVAAAGALLYLLLKKK